MSAHVQHSGLTKEKWLSFLPVQQILMIANEMNRAKRLFSPPDKKGLLLCYERILYLTDLTVQSNVRRGLRKELLRWRDLAAEEYLLFYQSGEMERPDNNSSLIELLRNRHLKLFRSLLLLHPESAKQISWVI